MRNTSPRFWLVGTAVIILVVTFALTSSITASRLDQVSPTSTPSAPEGRGGVVQERTSGPAVAPLVPMAPVASGGSLQSASPKVTDEQIQRMLDAVQKPTGGGRAGGLSDAPVGPSSDGVWQQSDGLSGTIARDLVADLEGAGTNDGAQSAGSNSGATVSPLGSSQLLVNGGFESGSWSPWSVSTNGAVGPVLTSAVKHSGTWSAHLGNELSTDSSSPDLDLVLQSFALPAGTPDAVEIGFWFRTETAETYFGYDYLCATLWDTAGPTLLYEFCGDMAGLGSIGWTKATWALTAEQRQNIAGKSLALGFFSQNDTSLVSRAWVDDVVFTVSTDVPPAATPECIEMLRNSQVDVVELGDGTGSVDYWAIVQPIVYYSTAYYHSSQYALKLADDNDTYEDVNGSDFDAFGQAFVAPTGLTELWVNYSRLYTNTNTSDDAFTMLWTLTDDGYLDQMVTMVPIGEDPVGWSNRFWNLLQPDDGITLAALSGRPLLLMLAEFSDRAPNYEAIYLDDIQVTVCYQRAPGTIYLPLAIRTYTSTTGPTCVDSEPDSVTARGDTDVGAVCDGGFSTVDQRDYYSLDVPGGVTQVRLALYDLPAGTNWDALIYEDAAGYPLACQIGTSGSADKYVDCTVNPAKTYFVMVNAGAPPQAGQTSYKMSVTQR